MDKHNSDMTVYLKNFQKISKNKQNLVTVEPFDSKERLCQSFEPFTLNFPRQKAKGGF